jgi:protein-S-isoprenylcysteine O-methyltransferase Ste14
MNDTQNEVTPAAIAGIRIHPPLLALGLIAVTLLLHFMLPEQRAVGWLQVIGLLVVAGGTGLSFFAAALFQARETTKNPYGEPAAFVAQRPYTFTRNPMYLGLTTALLGLALFFASPVMLIAPAAFFAVIDRIVIPHEEQTLERTFGPQYLEYKERVRRWI